MNLSEPLDGLTSEVEASVLRILARSDAGFSGRQVHALAGAGSTSSVHRALLGFAEVGLVTTESIPPAIVYRANREHVLWPAVEAALAARTRAFESISRFCEEELPEELRLSVVVYGSVARRESSLDSDLDLFVVYPDGIDDEARADFSYQIARHSRQITGSETQVFSLERYELAHRLAEHDPFLRNVLSDGILISGPALVGTGGVAS